MYAVSDDTQSRARRVVLLGMLMVAGLAASACSTGQPGTGDDQPSSVAPQPFSTPPTVSWPFGSPTSPGSAVPPSTLPSGIAVDRQDASSTAIAAARVWFGWDTTAETSPFAAALRTAPLMTAQCRQRLSATPPTGSPGNDWTALALVHARAVLGAGDVRLGSEDRPADTSDSAVRIVVVHQRFHADRPVRPRDHVVTVTMTRTEQGWSVTDDGQGRCGVVTR